MVANNLKGLTIEIGGDTTSLSNALKNVNKDISSLQSNLRTVNSALKLDPSNVEAMAMKQQLLAQAVNATREKLETLREAQRQADAQMAAGVDVDQRAYQSLQAEIVRTSSSLSDYERQLQEMGEAADDANDNLDDLGESADDADESLDDMDESSRAATEGFTVMKGVVANLITDALKKLADTLKDVAGWMLDVGMTYDSSMSNVKAISGATADQMALLEKKAKEMGESTKFSASEAADAFGYMALAGWDTEQMLGGIDGVLQLAAASGMDLATASDIVTDYISAFGLEAADAARMADQLAYAQTKSNTTVEQLAEAYRNSAANMNAAGQDIETTTSLLAMMANQGLKGSEAGTALTAMMRDLTAKMKDGKIQIGDTAIAVMGANGNYRDMTDILMDVEAATSGMGDAERATALSSTFTADSIRGLNLILNTGTDEAAKFEEELRKSGGTAGDVATVMQDNLAGDLTVLKSALEGVGLSAYEKFQEPLRQAVQTVTEYLGSDGAKGAIEKITTAVGDLATKIADNLPAIVDAVINAITFIVENMDSIIAVISAIGAAWLAFKAYNIVSTIVNGFAGIKAAAMAFIAGNPVALIVAAVAAAVVLIIMYKDEILAAISAAWEWIKNLFSGISEWFSGLLNGIAGFFTGAWNGIKKVWSGAGEFFKGVRNGINQAFENIGNWFSQKFTAAKDAAQKAWSGVKDYFGKVKDGITNVFSNVDSWMYSKFGESWTAVKNAFSNSVIGQYFGQIWNSIKGIFSAVKSVLSGNFSDAWSAIKGVFSGWGSFFSGLWNQVKSAFSGAFSGMASIGKDIVRGLWNGINDMVGWVVGKIQGFGETVLSGIKNFFGIKSPSRVMRDQVGRDLARGVGVGIEENADEAIKPMDDLVTEMTGVNIDRNISNTFRGTAVNEFGGLSERLDAVIEYLSRYLPGLAESASQGLYLDGDTLVGALGGRIDAELAKQYIKKGRGQ